MRRILGRQSTIRRVYATITAPTPADLILTLRNYVGKKAIVVACYTTANLVIPTQGVNYTDNQRFANGDNLVGGDGGRSTSTWCVWKGVLPSSFMISNLSSRSTYKTAILEYTDDVALNYSQELRGFNMAESNYKSGTTRR